MALRGLLRQLGFPEARARERTGGGADAGAGGGRPARRARPAVRAEQGDSDAAGSDAAAEAEADSEAEADAEEAAEAAAHAAAAGAGQAHKVLIFAQSAALLEACEAGLLAPRFPSLGRARLDGSVAPARRAELARRFNADPSLSLLLLTTGVGGLGLGLVGADTVVFLEPDWTTFRDLQVRALARGRGGRGRGRG